MNLQQPDSNGVLTATVVGGCGYTGSLCLVVKHVGVGPVSATSVAVYAASFQNGWFNGVTSPQPTVLHRSCVDWLFL